LKPIWDDRIISNTATADPMMKQIAHLVQTLLSAVILVILIFALILGALYVLDALSKSILFDDAIFAGLITALTAIIVVYISKTQERKFGRETHLRDKKVLIYEGIIKLIFKTAHATIDGKQLSKDELRNDMFKIMQNLSLWAPNEVVEAFVAFRKSGQNWDSTDAPLSVLNAVADLILAIRKDLGYNKKGMDRKKILGTFVSDIDEYIS